MIELNKIYNVDCLDLFREIDDDSIHLIVTSPPYFVNKEYEKTVSYDEYCNTMAAVFIETERVLIGGGYVVFNFGDYFNSGSRFYESEVPSCYPASINYFQWGVIKAGLDLQATRIWRKQFAKMGIPFVSNSHPRPIFDYEHVWTFRKKNGSKKEFVNDRKLSQRGVIGENWKSAARIDKHCAAYPIELPEWTIKVYSQNEGDIVFDPFCGSGTTCVAAKQLGRRYIGAENNSAYFELAQNKLLSMN